jgi:predicted nucleic acid-binding protein
MQKIIIADASCLILFEKIKELELLHLLFGIITITPEVATEFGLHL